MIGEIGGQDEQEAADFISHQRKKGRSKPVATFIAGVTAPPGRRMGHAGAIASGLGDSALEKIELMNSYGIAVSKSPALLGKTMLEVMQRKEGYDTA